MCSSDLVSTPGASVRLASDANPSDFIEIVLDSSGLEPVALGHTCHARNRRVIETERPVAEGPIADIADDQVLAFVLEALTPFVER